MKKIALLLKNSLINNQTYQIIEKLENDKDIELIFLLLDQKDSSTLSEKFYSFVFKIEEKIVQKFSPQDSIKYDISKIFQNIQRDYFSTHKLENLQNSGIDLVYSFINLDEVDNDLLKSITKDGYIYTLYSDNRKIKSKNIAFWEIYNREDSIGFSIHHNNKVLFRGAINTQRTKTQTQIRLYKESSTYIIKTLKEYANTGGLTTLDEKIIYTNPPLPSPTILQTSNYLKKTLLLYSKLLIKRLIFKQHPRFGVAFIRSSWENAQLDKGIEIKNPKNHFLADPFVWTKDNRTICFVEDFDYTQHIAWISAIEIFEDNSYKMLGEVIREDFHLSFPYLFTYEDELYMVPESTQEGTVRLYKCINFPLKWEYQYNLMENVKTADTMIFPHDNRWWLFTNMSTEGNDDQAAQLFAFYSDSPLSKQWTPHDKNPLVFDSDCGRNGGILFDQDIPLRGRQKQAFNIYGAGLSIAKITELSPSNYKEEKICDIKSTFFKNLKANHHIHSHQNITVYDYMRYEGLG